jgi:hypothetical protein
LPESPREVSHAVREINRGAELLEEVSRSLLDQSTKKLLILRMVKLRAIMKGVMWKA